MGRRAGPPHTLEHAAKLNQLILVKCVHCHRMVRYLASDLIPLFGPTRSAMDPPFACGKCGKWDYLRTDVCTPKVGDYGHLVIRRPNGVRKIQLWRNEVLGFRPGEEEFRPGRSD